ncbi:MAG: hypothetical protein F6K19_44670 [Cyanothece sp. SIO1E1]|nr:hypothetical protein [Cyanothece sp. SIO1E1]
MVAARNTSLKQNTLTPKTKLVSFENSHSWLKRHCQDGTLLIQAGYRPNPTGRFYRDDENPLVINGTENRWYGSRACQGEHVNPLYARKESTARENFAACLRQSDDNKSLAVVVSHWDEDTAQGIGNALIGDYSITRNGHQINCTVVEAFPMLEGMGTYHLVRPRLSTGSTLLFELGQGTSEEWLIDKAGFPEGNVTEQLSVGTLVKRIAEDQTVRGQLLSLGEQGVNLSLVTQALRTNELGSLHPEQWELIKNKYVAQWYEEVKAYVLKKHGNALQTVKNVVFSGGGAALLKDRLSFAIIPDQPETASVRGAYEYQLARIGA